MKIQKIKSLLIILVTIYSFNMNGQTINYEEVVYLKNGSVIKGVILEQIPNVSLKIKTKDENVFVFKMDEVEKIAKLEIIQKKNDTDETIKMKQKGFSSINELGANILLSNNTTKPMVAVHTINGYLINSNIFVGLGAGIETDASIFIIPIYAHGRFYLTKTKVAPYFGLSGGYGITTVNGSSTLQNGGALGEALFGLKFQLNSMSALNFSLGYKLQYLVYEIPLTPIFNGSVSGKTTYKNIYDNASNIFVRIGVTF